MNFLKKYFNGLIIILLFSIGSCQSNNSKLDEKMIGKWNNDLNGCLNERTETAKYLAENALLLKGYNEKKIIKMLGVPQKTTLYTRGQKFFVYDVSCVDHTDISQLQIRFNALGQTSEVLFMN